MTTMGKLPRLINSIKTYHVGWYFELAQSEAPIPHHCVITKMSLHAIEQRGDDASLHLHADTILFLPLYYVEQGGTKSASKCEIPRSINSFLCNMDVRIISLLAFHLRLHKTRYAIYSISSQ